MDNVELLFSPEVGKDDFNRRYPNYDGFNVYVISSLRKKEARVNYKSAPIEELFGALCDQERHPNLDLIEALLERDDEVVPGLVDILETERSWPQIHAGLLLCELRAESALPALQWAISAPEGHDLADWLVDDALEKFGPPVLDILEVVAADKTVEWYQRAVACRVMRTIAYRHPETYERVTAFLRGLLPDPDLDWQAYESYEALKEAVDDPQIWTTVVARLCDLRDPEAYDLIGQLFQAGLVNELFMDVGFYRKAYEKSGWPGDISKKPLDLLSRYRRSQPKEGKVAPRARRARKKIKRRRHRK